MHALSRFSFPTVSIYGAGALETVPEQLNELSVSRPLVVTERGVALLSIYHQLLDILKRADIDFSEYTQIRANPTDADISRAAEVFRNGGCDSVIGIGGGSALDAAKAAAVIAAQGGTVDMYDVQQGGGDTITAVLPPILAVPTTSGTGSEVGKCAVITSTAEMRKYMVCHPQMLPKRAILDPELTLRLPAHITAATGMDALIHCIESLASPVFNPLCDAIAVKGIQLASAYLEKAVHEPRDIEARGNMMLAAMMGAIAFQKDLGACHSLSHALTAVCSIPHGLANAVCILPVMRFNLDAAEDAYAQTAAAFGENIFGLSPRQAGERAIERIAELNKAIGIPDSLRELKVKKEELSQIIDTAYRDPCHLTNPKPCTKDDLMRLLQEAWKGGSAV